MTSLNIFYVLCSRFDSKFWLFNQMRYKNKLAVIYRLLLKQFFYLDDYSIYICFFFCFRFKKCNFEDCLFIIDHIKPHDSADCISFIRKLKCKTLFITRESNIITENTTGVKHIKVIYSFKM